MWGSWTSRRVKLARRRAARKSSSIGRLGPDVPIEVADIVGPDGEVCDHLAVRHRMPDDRQLATRDAVAGTGAMCLTVTLNGV